ncbi:molybdopterin synthase catalytic subunit MoaE [Leeia sp.]|uniref:molybdopterin synthase catalytic subunit MoaE n=1 Tax=Leeia sp. TaxID=2884678 RepID=UPI0035AE77DA
MVTRIRISVQAEDFDGNAEQSELHAGDGEVGAIVSFTGLVRDQVQGKALSSLYLEHYPGMTEQSLQHIAEQAAERWPLQAVRIIHRIGPLAPLDRIVLVLAASAHRQAAFDACAFIMDYLKTRAPFWKKEQSANGEAWWVDARDSDETALHRWQ